MNAKETERLTKDWQDYVNCKQFLESKGFYVKNDRAYRFFEGDQWDDNVPDGQPMPQLNVIRQGVEYKIATVLKNGMTPVFSNQEYKDKNLAEFTEAILSKINNHILKVWEQNNMDSEMWVTCQDACISGGAGIYSYYDEETESIKIELKNNTDILFADEQQKDVQKQKYIILPFRRMVSEVIAEAKENGVSEEDISQITADSDMQNQVGSYAKTEINMNDEKESGKCLCLLKLWKNKDGKVMMRKSTRSVVYVKDTDTNLKLYPIAFVSWNTIKGGIRGKGDVIEWIPNQVEINKNLARRAVSIMMTAYPKMAYDIERIPNPSELLEIGATIGVDGGNIGDVSKMVGYISPQQISPDAGNYVAELITKTQEMSGASTYALGNVNPERTSGRAILAVRDASAIPLNIQIAKVKKYVEDIGRIWWEIFSAYSSDGMNIVYDNNAKIADESGKEIEKKETLVEKIPAQMLTKIKLSAKVDINANSVYDKFAVEQTLENFLTAGIVSFDEYSNALPDDAVAPKRKFLELVEKRAEIQQLVAERDQYKLAYTQATEQYQALVSEIPKYAELGQQVLSEMAKSKKGSSAKVEKS